MLSTMIILMKNGSVVVGFFRITNEECKYFEELHALLAFKQNYINQNRLTQSLTNVTFIFNPEQKLLII